MLMARKRVGGLITLMLAVGSAISRITLPATLLISAVSSLRGASSTTMRAPESTRFTPASPSASTCVQTSSMPCSLATASISLNLRSSTNLVDRIATLSADAAPKLTSASIKHSK